MDINLRLPFYLRQAGLNIERMCYSVNNAGIWSGIILLAYAATILYQSLTLDYSTRLGPGPGFFPLWLSAILIILIIAYIWDSFKSNTVKLSDILPPDKRARDNILLTLGGLFVFPLIVEFLGFIVSGSILLFIMCIREFKWYTSLGMAIGISCLLFFVFQSLLGVTLPVNEFGW